MRRQLAIVITSIFFLVFFASNATADWEAHGDFSEERIGGTPKGNHKLDCTVIRPWLEEGLPESVYPVIGWANGWGGNEVAGKNEIEGYKPGLIDWAVDGPFIVIAANQWSARERDVLQCVAWLIEQNSVEESEYYGHVNTERIGLSGHSQGGGAVLRAGDGTPKGVGLDLDIPVTTVIAMNPYGPSWNEVNPKEPVLIVGGMLDTTTSPGSYEEAWQQILTNQSGGVNATEIDGTHNNNAWVPADDYNNPQDYNFGNYQALTTLWWKIHLNGESYDDFCYELACGNGNWAISDYSNLECSWPPTCTP